MFSISTLGMLMLTNMGIAMIFATKGGGRKR